MRKKILVVDDESDIRELLKARLVHNGYECLTAEDGREAVKIAKETIPDLIILDLIMPGMDGIETQKALKADPATKNIPIVGFTAQPPEIIAKKGEKAWDVVDVMLKSLDTKELLSIVEQALK